MALEEEDEMTNFDSKTFEISLKGLCTVPRFFSLVEKYEHANSKHSKKVAKYTDCYSNA